MNTDQFWSDVRSKLLMGKMQPQNLSISFTMCSQKLFLQKPFQAFHEILTSDHGVNHIFCMIKSQYFQPPSLVLIQTSRWGCGIEMNHLKVHSAS